MTPAIVAFLLGLYVLPRLSVELDGHVGKTDWAAPGGAKSITYMPWAVRARVR